MNLKALQEKRNQIATQMRDMLKRAEDEERRFTAEEREQWERMTAEISEIDEAIDEARKLHDDLDAIAKRAGEPLGTRVPVGPEPESRTEPEERSQQDLEREAFRAWIRGGMAALGDEHRAIVQQRMTELPAEARALAVGTGAAGGFTVPEDFYRQLEEAMKAYGAVRNVATIIRTDSGANLPMPTVNDTGNVGAIVNENTQVTEQDVTFGQVTLGAYMYSSKIVRVSLQLLQDSAFDIEAYLARAFAERLGRATNAHFTTGTGTGQPAGIVTGATLGKTGATGQTTSVTYNDLVDLVHSVDPAYRALDGRWMMHDQTLAAIKKLVDSQGRPLWAPGIIGGEPDRILGYPYEINNDMPTMAASAKSILFGALSKYHIREVLGIQMLRLQERYADFLQVGFLAFMRTDGVLLDAGTNPVKYYQNSAT